MDLFTPIDTYRAATRILLAINLFLINPVLNFRVIATTKFQRIRRSNGNAGWRLSDLQASIGAEVTFVGNPRLWVEVADMERASGNAVVTSNTARLIHLYNAIFVTK